MTPSHRLTCPALLCLLALLQGTASRAAEDPLEAVVQVPHLEAVIAVAFSPDGNTFATGSNDHTAKLWDFASGHLLRTFTGHTGNVDHVAFTPDGRRLLTSDSEGLARLWEVSTGRLVRGFGDDKTSLHGASLSADGRFLFGVGYYDKHARVFSVDSGELREMPGGVGLWPYLLNADGSRVLAGRRTKDGSRLELLDARSGAAVTMFAAQDTNYTGLALSPDGKRFAAGSFNTVRLWSLETKKELSTATFSKDLSSLTFSRDGQRLAAAISNEHLAVVIDTTTGATLRALHTETPVNAVAFRADGNYLLVATSAGVTLWDLSSGHLEYQLSNGDKGMEQLSEATLSPDGLYATTGAQVWNLATAKLSKPMRVGTEGAPAVVALITPDSRTAIGVSSGREGSSIRRWELTTGRALGELTLRQKGKLHAISADGRFVAMAEYLDNSMFIWDVVQGKQVHALGVHPSHVSAAAFSRDGRFIATGSWTDEENTVMIWDAASGKRRHELKMGGGYMDELAFSPNGALLAAPSMFTTTLFNAATGQRVAELPAPGTQSDSTLVFIDDQTLAAGDFNGDIRLWNVAAHSLIATLRGHSNYVRKLSVSADGRTLLSASHDGTAKLWDVPKKTLVATLVPAGEDDYAILSPDNDYAASRGAARRVMFVKGMKAYSFDNFDLTKNRPDRVAELQPRDAARVPRRTHEAPAEARLLGAAAHRRLAPA